MQSAKAYPISVTTPGFVTRTEFIWREGTCGLLEIMALTPGDAGIPKSKGTLEVKDPVIALVTADTETKSLMFVPSVEI